MGLITSRLNLDSLQSDVRQRSHQNEEQLYNYSLHKNFFSNYFLMGGERFEVNDPEYLFGDGCDLNFLTCTKPYTLPYKKAQQNLLTNLDLKQKAINKVSSRVSSLSSPLNILTGRHRQVSQSRKQDAQTQTLNNGKKLANGSEPSQPLVMLLNIRKETLRLVKSSHVCNIDSDQNSLTNSASNSNMTSEKSATHHSSHSQKNHHKVSKSSHKYSQKTYPTITYSTTSNDDPIMPVPESFSRSGGEDIELKQTIYNHEKYQDSDTSSMMSNNTLSSSHTSATTSSTGKSGYTSVRDVPLSDSASEDGDYFEDALNEPTTSSTDNDSENNQQKSLLRATGSRKDKNCDTKIIMESDEKDVTVIGACDMKDEAAIDNEHLQSERANSTGSKTTSTKILRKVKNRKSITKTDVDKTLSAAKQQASNRIYNIEFTFDAEVDCSIRVSYFCTRVVSSNNVSYKPLHATYKSKTYTYKRGLNQKFEQQEHAFRPYLFDEDLLIYKPLDSDGNYNSGAVFPIVINCVALEGPMPRQSQSLVATVEKSHLDDSYSIKPLKQMIFADGVQYILQDIYGIENRPLISKQASLSRRAPRLNRTVHASCGSICLSSSMSNSNINLSDTASMGSMLEGGDTSLTDSRDRGSLISGQFRSLGCENTFECVICMSEERDTMLLPCRHMCLCSSCAQSLRYQSSSCPICRCPFKAALHIRFMRNSSNRKCSSDLAIELAC